MSTETTRRRTQYHHGDLRQALLDATIDIARTEGLPAITMRSVSARAGVSEAAPYHHFSSKADLLAAAAVVAFHDLGDAITAGVQAAEAEDREAIIGGSEAYVRFALTNAGEYQLLFGRHIADLALDTREEVLAAGSISTQAALAALSEALEQRGSSATAEEVFPLLRAVLHGTVSLVHERELGPDASVDEAVALAVRAVAALLDGLGEPHAEESAGESHG